MWPGGSLTSPGTDCVVRFLVRQETSNVFNDRCASIDRRFTQWGAEFSEQNRHALTQCESRVDGVSQRLETCESTMVKLVSECAEASKSVAHTSAHVTKQFAELDKRLRESHQAQDATTQNARSALDSKLAVVADGLAAMETSHRSLTLSADATTKTVADSQTQLQQLQQHLEERIRDEHENGQQSLQSLWSEVNAQKVHTDKRHRAAEEHWQMEISKVEQSITDNGLSTDSKIGDLKRFFSQETENVTSRMREADAQHDAKIKEVQDDLARNGASPFVFALYTATC